MLAGVTAWTGTALAQDAWMGKDVSRKCQKCHVLGPGTAEKVGPPLMGIVGRPAASVEGFDYSDAMKAAGKKGLVWTEEKLFQYLASPARSCRKPAWNSSVSRTRWSAAISSPISRRCGERASSAPPSQATAPDKGRSSDRACELTSRA